MKFFIHGVPDTGDMWMPLIEALGLAEGRYATPTMPGFDGQWPSGFAATKEAYLDWLIARLESTAEAAGAPVDLVGHDWGALLVAMAALARPQHVRSWCLINAAPEPSYRWHLIARGWQTPLLGELVMALGSQKRFRRQLVAAGMPRKIARLEAPRIDRHMKRAILKLYRSARNPGAWAADFSPIADRGLVLWGASDRFVPVAFAHRFTTRWEIPLIVEDGVGHWGLCKRPEAFSAPLNALWARLA